MQDLDPRALHKTELQQPTLQLIDANAVIAWMALGADFDNDADVAWLGRTQSYGPLVYESDFTVGGLRDHVVHCYFPWQRASCD